MLRLAIASASLLLVLAPAAGGSERVRADSQIWALDIATRDVHHFTQKPGDYDLGRLSWAPDGTRAAVIESGDKGDGIRERIVLLSRSGHVVRRLWATYNLMSYVTWSATGRRLLVEVEHPSDSDYEDDVMARNRWLSTVGAGGGGRHVLTHNAHGAGWSPAGERVAYVAGFGAHRRVVVSSSSGSKSRVLATGERLVFTAWSRDGSYVFYEQRKPRDPDADFEPYYDPAEALWRVPVSGGEPELVATNVSNFVGESPERGWILFTRERPDPLLTEDVWMARSDGSDARMLLARHYIDTPLGWAPATRGAYLVGHAKKRPLPLFLFPTDGERRNLGRIGYGGIVWSPDGRTIAWDNYVRKIRLMNEDGSDRKTLLRLPGDIALDSAPHWTPDGKTLLFKTGIVPD